MNVVENANQQVKNIQLHEIITKIEELNKLEKFKGKGKIKFIILYNTPQPSVNIKKDFIITDKRNDLLIGGKETYFFKNESNSVISLKNNNLAFVLADLRTLYNKNILKINLVQLDDKTINNGYIISEKAYEFLKQKQGMDFNDFKYTYNPEKGLNVGILGKDIWKKKFNQIKDNNTIFNKLSKKYEKQGINFIR